MRVGQAHLALAPDMGGAVASLSVGGRPVLRPWNRDPSDGPFALAANVLIPFSNRISGGGFAFRGAWFDMPPNLEGEDNAIHGDAFQRPWLTESHAKDHARLSFPGGAFGPYRYGAEQDIHLDEDALSITLTVRNTGAQALPFGCGFHPWFPRTPDTRLCFDCTAMWTENSNHLPMHHLPLEAVPEFDFSRPRPLPAGWINNAFTGWAGRARISQGPAFQSVTLEADPVLSTAIVFSPGKSAPFFCFEPVAHPVDAHNLPGQPGLTILAPGETLCAGYRIIWKDQTNA